MLWRVSVSRRTWGRKSTAWRGSTSSSSRRRPLLTSSLLTFARSNALAARVSLSLARMLSRRPARVGVASLRLAPPLRPQLSPRRVPPQPVVSRGRQLRIGERSVFGLPTPSNEPLAGTIDGSGPPWLFLLQVFLGLPALLWAYKVSYPFVSFQFSQSAQCLVLVVFQRRIIYLPSVPPGTRNESLAPPSTALASQLNGLEWGEVSIESNGRSRWTRTAVKLRGLELRSSAASQASGPQVVVIYLQGKYAARSQVQELIDAQATPVHPSFASLSSVASSPHLSTAHRSPSTSSPSLLVPSGSQPAPLPPNPAFLRTTRPRSSTPSPPTPTRNSSSTATASVEPPRFSSFVLPIFGAGSVEWSSRTPYPRSLIWSPLSTHNAGSPITTSALLSSIAGTRSRR